MENRLLIKENINRIYKFLRMEIFLRLKDIILIFSIVYGIVFVNIFFSLIFRRFSFNNVIEIKQYYIIALFIGLIVIISNSFTRIYEKRWTIFYFTLPGSLFQKVVSKFLFAIVFYFLFNLILFILVYFLTYFLAILFSLKIKIITFNVFLNDLFIESFWIYFYIGSIFFFFSTIWEKNSFFNTIFVLFLFFLFLSISIYLILDILIKMNIINVFNFEIYSFNILDFFQDFKGKKIILYFLKTIYYLIPFVFYVLSYFSFKRKQVSGR